MSDRERMDIRSARRGEAAYLSELAFRSKSHWPYPDDSLAAYRPALEVFEEDIAAGAVFVGRRDDSVIGFYALSSDPARHRLYFMFVEPASIGLGYGKRLWQHALGTARQRGWTDLEFYSDRFAFESFYKYQGCTVIGSIESDLGTLLELRVNCINAPAE